ncbi:hypothetical protein ACUXVY_12710 [Chromobacterium haemolyticum]|uniref:hypothetical protein n=1 Tax=Chromobacterium haemolyticum TaxID=394935 RepID=UPI001317F086|nr:hypothetical protein [Chromobacterium haemolyticum]BBH11742.1 hypothetical protein CH06BL_09900 [Chromobacterium haemolyticum]
MQLHTRNFSSKQNISQAKRTLFSGVFISPLAKFSYHEPMDLDVFAIRRLNLEKLLAGRGAAARIAANTGSSASYISTLKSADRRMGDDIARRIEDSERLPHGWLDQIHSDSDEEETVIVAGSIDELVQQMGKLETEELHKVIARALDLHAKKKS